MRRRLEASDIKDLNILKHYRIIRKWACRNNGLNDAELELLISLASSLRLIVLQQRLVVL